VIVYGLLIYLIIYNEIKPFVEVTRLKQVLLGSTLGFLFWGYSFIYPSPVLTYLREQTRLNELIIGFMLVLGNFIITILLIPLTAASYCFICSFADEYRKRATKKT
jgi:Zn-dependent protease